jgi:hypothetical protein
MYANAHLIRITHASSHGEEDCGAVVVFVFALRTNWSFERKLFPAAAGAKKKKKKN